MALKIARSDWDERTSARSLSRLRHVRKVNSESSTGLADRKINDIDPRLSGPNPGETHEKSLEEKQRNVLPNGSRDLC